MSGVISQLSEALDNRAVRALAREMGVTTAQASRAIKAAVPVLVERLEHNAEDGSGADELARAVAEDHDGSVLEDAARALGSYRAGPGLQILRHVFGDEVDIVVARLAVSTGLPPGVVEGALTAVAPLALGAITKAALGAITAAAVVTVLRVAKQQIDSGQAQAALARVGTRLDGDGDGNPVDDMARGAADLARRGARNVAMGAKAFARDERVQRAARSARDGAAVGAREGATLAKRAFGRIGRLFG